MTPARANRSDFELLTVATLRIYANSLATAARGVLRNWWLVPLHIVVFIAGGLLVRLAVALLGPLAGGFAAALILAVVLAFYLSTVAAAAEKERLILQELWPRTLALFSPLLGVLFALFILNTVAAMALRTPDSQWILMAIHLVVAVLFNTLPEAIYNGSRSVSEIFSECLEFMRENFIEWFLPLVIIGLPLFFAYGFDLTLRLALTVAMINPLRYVDVFMGALLQAPLLSAVLLWTVLLYLFYFAFAFRGALYHSLSTSTRRKRIYGERTR